MEHWRALDANNGSVKVEPRRVCRPVIADLHHFDEAQDPDPHPHHSDKSDPDPHQRRADPRHNLLPFPLLIFLFSSWWA